MLRRLERSLRQQAQSLIAANSASVVFNFGGYGQRHQQSSGARSYRLNLQIKRPLVASCATHSDAIASSAAAERSPARTGAFLKAAEGLVT